MNELQTLEYLRDRSLSQPNSRHAIMYARGQHQKDGFQTLYKICPVHEMVIAMVGKFVFQNGSAIYTCNFYESTNPLWGVQAQSLAIDSSLLIGANQAICRCVTSVLYPRSRDTRLIYFDL